MAAIETTTFDPTDAADCMGLSLEAGWNQTQADWEMMLRTGWAPGLRGPDGQPQASALALPMADGIGWISMVLVTQAQRRKGIAQHLVGLCIDWLEAHDKVPVLDATPAGQPLYARMGFAPVCGLTRMAGAGCGTMPDGLSDIGPTDIDWIAAQDRAALGAGRTPILKDLLGRENAIAMADEQDGFVLSRAGSNATQVGPLVAKDEQTALKLLRGALSKIDGPILIDTYDGQPAIAAHLDQLGFQVQRPFLRMTKGLTHGLGDPNHLFAAAGPELG